jgi:hypothetical protein
MHDFSYGLTYVITLMFLGEVLDLKKIINGLKDLGSFMGF